jgi:replication fork protection complex subunit Tof1/Swi1
MPAISNDGYDSLDEARPPPDSGIEVPEDMPSQQFRYQIFLPVVQNLVNALGGFEPVKKEDGTTDVIYRPGDSVLAVLKDLKKMWRKDDTDDERTVARCMARAGLMKELVGLVKECAPRGDWGRKVSLMARELDGV